MKKYFFAGLALTVLAGAPYFVHAAERPTTSGVAQSEKGRWLIAEDSLTLKSKSGVTVKQIRLGSEDQTSDVAAGTNREVRAIVPDSGKCALVLERSKKPNSANTNGQPTEQASEASSIRYYGQNADAIWQRENVDGELNPRVADSCEEVLVVTTNLLDCNIEEDLGCLKTIFVIDKKGAVRLQMGPYISITRISLSNNGKYGFAEVRDARRGEYLFFSTSGRIKPREFTEALPGAIRLREDGVVEFVKNEHGEWQPDGTRKVIRSKLVRTLKIE